MMAMTQCHDVVVYNGDGQGSAHKQKGQQGAFVALKHIIFVNPANKPNQNLEYLAFIAEQQIT